MTTAIFPRLVHVFRCDLEASGRRATLLDLVRKVRTDRVGLLARSG